MKKEEKRRKEAKTHVKARKMEVKNRRSKIVAPIKSNWTKYNAASPTHPKLIYIAKYAINSNQLRKYQSVDEKFRNQINIWNSKIGTVNFTISKTVPIRYVSNAGFTSGKFTFICILDLLIFSDSNFSESFSLITPLTALDTDSYK